MASELHTYTVSVYTTPMSLPLSFTCHSWVEVSHNDHCERFDFWAYPGFKTANANHGYVYKDIFPNHLGTTVSPFVRVDNIAKRQTGKIVSTKTGRAGSDVQKLYTKIKASAFLYPLHSTYNMILGPNCNSYTQWLLQLVPEVGLTLPWYAWGKNYYHRPR